MTDETPNKGGRDPLAPAHLSDVQSLPDEAIDQLQLSVVAMLYPLLRLTRQPDRIGNGDVTDMHRALARAELLVEDGLHYWLVIEGIALADTMSAADLASPLANGSAGTARFARLVQYLIEAGDSRNRPRRGPLHKALVDLHLHERVDMYWTQVHPKVDLLRIGTAILIPCVSASMGVDMRDTVLTLIACHGGKCSISGVVVESSDLSRGETAEWAGFEVHVHGARVKVKPSQASWRELEVGLFDIQGPHRGIEASRVLCEWLRWMAPAYDHAGIDKTYERLRELLNRLGFAFPLNSDTLRHVWAQAYREWRGFRKGFRRERGREQLD